MRSRMLSEVIAGRSEESILDRYLDARRVLGDHLAGRVQNKRLMEERSRAATESDIEGEGDD